MRCLALNENEDIQAVYGAMKRLVMADGIVTAEEKIMLDAFEGDKIMSQIERGETETFPGELIHNIIDRENPVKTYRKYRGVTQSELALAADLKQPAICPR